MNEQVDNTASVNAEVDDAIRSAVLESSGDDFFEAMDKQVNSAVYSDEAAQEKATLEQTEAPDELGDEYEVLKKRYGDSSRESKRLNQRIKELEPYAPILDAMREDPNLIAHVRNYFQGNSGESPQSVKEELDLPDDFIFDADDAVSDPDSLSASVLQRTVDGVVQRRLSSFAARQRSENEKITRESKFRAKHDLNDEDYREVIDYAKGKTLALDDVYYLMNREKKESAIADSARQEVIGQMKKVRDRPRSAAHVGSEQVDVGPDDAIFDAILGIDNELENAFG